jgi:hypothetical protein
LAIEGEMAIRIGEDGEIAAAFPVIELHHFIFRAPRKTLVELVANNGLNAGVVLPADGRLSPCPHSMGRARLSVQIGDRRAGSGELWPLPGGAAASVDWLRQHLSVFGLALTPGQIVLSGTPLGLYPVVPGDDVIVFFDNEPAVRCSIVYKTEPHPATESLIAPSGMAREYGRSRSACRPFATRPSGPLADRPSENCLSARPFPGLSEHIEDVRVQRTYQRARRGSIARETRTTVPQPTVYQTAM